MKGQDIVSKSAQTFLQIFAGAAFLAAAFVIINMIRNTFNRMYPGGVRQHWVLFAFVSLIPLIALLFAFIYLSKNLKLLI